MLQSRSFWVLFTLVAVASTAMAFVYFPLAFPLVSLDLSMDREMALSTARSMAVEQEWGPSEFRQAASFGLDSRVQNYVELEAGGNDAFRKMISEGRFAPYTWRVRHFKEGETLETSILFTPAGRPYGFSQKLPEDTPGASIERDAARSVAEQTAIDAWTVDLSEYELVEASQEVRPGGRTDHTFVYRLRNEMIGEGEYRLRLVVGGDHLTALTHFVKVPEAFTRRYQEMRSANDTIANVAGIAIVVFYILGGCLVGSFFLLRHRWVWPRPAFGWGFFIAFLQVLAAINQWPLLWMSYDTALSSESFLMRQAVGLLALFFGMGLLLSLSFMAAEGLTRRAFGNQIRFWKLWSRPVASTPAVAGMTVAGYLLVGLFFAYEVGLYFFSTNWLGWWTPSSALFNPDVLAAYFPWLSSIAISLQAGFWEECLFRAVPIAGAALIGERLGQRRAWIIGAFVLQALIFAAGHANYPAQPAYARVAELAIPSLFFGWIYLRFGLLTAIVLHYAFDVVWFAMPLFVSTAPGVWVDQFMVVMLTLVPLWVVLGARLRHGKWGHLSDDDLNRTWQPAVAAAPAPVPAREKTQGAERKNQAEQRPVIHRFAKRVVLAAGLVLFIAWAFDLDVHTDAPPFKVRRDEAIEVARRAVAARGIVLPDTWRVMTAIRGGVQSSHRFVWEKGGESAYQQLFGSYLVPPQWQIRFATFEGDVAERAEEYHIFLDSDGKLSRFRHQLPEARPGARLSEDEVRQRGVRLTQAQFGARRDGIEEISIKPSKQPHRTDWLVTFAERENYPLDEGEARISVSLEGDEFADAYRWVHIPEEWQRQEREKATRFQIVLALCSFVVAGCFMGGIAGGIIAWSRKQFDRGLFLSSFGLLSGVGLFGLFNSWPAEAFRFQTSQPLERTILTTVGVALVGILISAAAPALIIGFIHGTKSVCQSVARHERSLLGLALGAIFAGITALVRSWTAPSLPKWPDYDPKGAYLPLFQAAFSPLSHFVLAAALLLLLFFLAHRFSRGWTQRKALTVFGLFIFGLALGAFESHGDWVAWIAVGSTTGLLLVGSYLFLFRYALCLVPLAVGMFMVLATLEEGLHRAYTAALPGALLAAILIVWLSILWSGKLQEPRAGPLNNGL